MNCPRRFPVLLAMAALAAPGSARAAAVGKADIDKAVAAIAGYDNGKPRRPLFAVEEIIRKTQGQAELRVHLERKLIDLLRSAASHECKLFVCQQLWAVGSDAGVPTLQAMLLDEKTAHMACYALGENPSPKVAQALRDALGKARGKARICIVSLLGDRRDDQSVAALTKLLAAADATVAEAAAAALGNIATDEAAKALGAARGTAAAPRLQTAATHAYLHAAQRLAAQGSKAHAIAIYAELNAQREPKVVRRAALIGLIATQGAEAVPLIIATVRGGDPVMRATAIANIRTLKGRGVGQRFAAELPKLPPGVQALLVGALADRGDPAVRPAIAAAAASANAEVRTAAVKALGKIGDAESVELLAHALADGKSDAEKRAAQLSLRLLRGDGVDAAIIRAVQAAKSRARAELIRILRSRSAASAVPALLKEAASQDEGVRKEALRALATLAGAKDVPALIGLLVRRQAEATREAERAVVAAARKIADEASRADAVLAALTVADRDAARCSLLRVLGGIANAKALEALRTALKHASPAVQDAAVRALANWPDARATAALVAVVRTTRNDAHRVVALRGLVRLLGFGGGRPAQGTLEAYAEALSHARRPDEKKLVLAGLANMGHPAALKLVEPLMADPAVGAEAALATVKIAQAIAGTRGQAAAAAMSRLLAASKDPRLRRQAQQIIRAVARFEDYITSWQVAGPYVQEGKGYKQLFGVAFPPEKPDAKDVPWRVLPAATNPQQPWMLDLLAALGGEQRVGYVRTWVHAEKPQQARLEFGTDDGNKVWLNGRLVFAKNIGGAAIPGAYKANVTLRKGWNALLLKVTQASGPWQFCARLRRRDGTKLEGVRADCLHKEP